MNVLRFINSKDIRKHLEDIGYAVNSLEAAWLIYQCRDATIREKHEAWKELIETMPDCRIEKRINTVPQESLHGFLKKYMELDDRLTEEFYDEKHADTFDSCKPFVYQFKYIHKDGSTYVWDTVFSCFDALYENVMEPSDDVVLIECTKTQIDRLSTRQTAYITPSFEMLRLDPGYFEDDSDNDIYWGVFDGLWFAFPTPFHKGDIVWDPKKPEGFCGGPFVTTGVCFEEIKNEKVKENLRKNGDSSDMSVGGYFLNEDGSIYAETTSNYMDLEFFTEELTGKQKTLIGMSNCIKGTIDPALFARAYHEIITAGYAADSMPRDYTPSGMILAGLSDEKMPRDE